jgi:uncharacterized repeat protein (TIGR03803 family)
MRDTNSALRAPAASSFPFLASLLIATIVFAALVVCAVFLISGTAKAGTLTILHAFHGGSRDGANPHAAPFMDGKGDLYGTTEAGGPLGCGTVYKLHKSHGAWNETILYSFQCGDDGFGPVGGVITDSAGNLYGGTQLGGTGECYFDSGRVGCGAVYKLTPGNHGVWTETTLYSWPAPSFNFAGPVGSLTLDAKGTLYGTTLSDNPCKENWGSVFSLTPLNGNWKESEVHDFCGKNGHGGRFGGFSPLVFDAAGNLYGTPLAAAAATTTAWSSN